jgi:hypothetical protein
MLELSRSKVASAVVLALAAFFCGCSATKSHAGNFDTPQEDDDSSGPNPTSHTQCTYPASNFGDKKGNVAPPMHTWQGYVNDSSTEVPVKIEDFYDCDGTRGINAVLIDTSAVWCEACQQEATDMSANLAGAWKDLGIRVLTLIDEDAQSMPATSAIALAWKTKYKLDRSTVAADPADTFLNIGESTIGLPLLTLVDPRTMQIVDVQEGYSGNYSSLLALAAKNKKPE